MRWFHVVLLAGLAGISAAADPGEEARAAYESGLRKDGLAFEEQWRDLNRRFKTSLEKLHVGARDRGDLDETLAAKQLWERVRPLVTGTIFGAASPAAGRVPCPLPAAPEGKGLTAQAYTSYVAKAAALVDQFNAAASNRHARYVSGLDGAIRERTKAGEIDAAVKLREQRTASQRAGPLAIGMPAVPTPLQAVPPVPANAFLGRWQAEALLSVVRDFRPDGRVEYLDKEDRRLGFAPYRIQDATTAVVVTSEGWVDVYRLQSATAGEVEARRLSGGATQTYRFWREGAVAGGHPILGTWCDTWDAAYPGQTRMFDPQGVFRAAKSNGVEYARGPYKLTGPDTAEFVWPDKTITRYRALSDGRLQLRRLQIDGTEQVSYCTRPGIVQAMTVWAPGEEAKGTWAKDWTFEGRGVQTGLAKLYSAGGRDRIWQTHPVNAATPSKWVRTVQLSAGRPHKLRLDVRSHGPQDWELTVRANGDELLKRVIDRDAWQRIEVDLNRYAGQKVKMELLNGGGGAVRWSGEYGYWDNVSIE